ncbi:hypothetical protein BLOT_009519 [Blomia tropicalis]|nr:hypothetical protein BLOT_009519 [Blomia tropicalis]
MVDHQSSRDYIQIVDIEIGSSSTKCRLNEHQNQDQFVMLDQLYLHEIEGLATKRIDGSGKFWIHKCPINIGD